MISNVAKATQNNFFGLIAFQVLRSERRRLYHKTGDANYSIRDLRDGAKRANYPVHG